MIPIEITPQESVAPVYLDNTPHEPISFEIDFQILDEQKKANRESAISKLKKLGLTEEEALALAGG